MAEKEYIEREKAIKKLDHFQSHLHTVEGTTAIGVAKTLINEVPAADVRPVRRGKWETVMFDHERMGCRRTAHYCSECHQITWFRTFYCPNCGADMREES